MERVIDPAVRRQLAPSIAAQAAKLSDPAIEAQTVQFFGTLAERARW